jgi:hypothetical protein
MDIITELGPTHVAMMVGVKPPSAMEWRKRGVPPDRCPAIERGTNGRYTCEQLRPDVHWVRIPDPQWPWHAEGRPCIDVAAAQSVPAAEQRAA